MVFLLTMESTVLLSVAGTEAMALLLMSVLYLWLMVTLWLVVGLLLMDLRLLMVSLRLVVHLGLMVGLRVVLLRVVGLTGSHGNDQNRQDQGDLEKILLVRG